MRQFIRKLPKTFAVFFAKQNTNKKIIECDTLNYAEFLWQHVYLPEGWDIESPIEVAWSSKLKRYCYRFAIKKHC